MDQEARFFIVKAIMHGYVGSPRRYANRRLLEPCVLYEAPQVGKDHLVAVRLTRRARSIKPAQEIYVPLKSKQDWSQVEFAPEMSDLIALFNPPAPML